jgi:hypothetical protein
VPTACLLAPERVIEYPAPAELPHTLHDKVLEWAEEMQEGLYDFQLSAAPGTKVGGHVAWTSRPEIPRCKAGHVMEHLVTVASTECDVGTHERWLPVEERALWDSPGTRAEIQRPAHVMIGDMGALVAFVCRRCHGWPVAWSLQSS